MKHIPGMKDLFDDRPISPIEQPPKGPTDPPFGVPPEVLALFEKLALHIRERGFKRYSSDAILHRIRWHYHFERGLRDFKCNNNWTAPMARWCLSKYPGELENFFELRRSPHSDDDNGE